MPPKMAKDKKAVKKPKPFKPVEPTENELLLQEELQYVTGEIDSCRKRVAELQEMNRFLEEEANKVRIEAHEYMNYVGKRANKRKTTIVTLSDYNREEIKKIQSQKQQAEEIFDKKKKAIQKILFEKQYQLEKINQQIQGLQDCKDLETNQLKKINALEEEIKEIRAVHTKSLQEMKYNFLMEKTKYQKDSDSKIQALEKQAGKEAVNCLDQHTDRIKSENRDLRRQLLDLIHTTQTLNKHRVELEEQRKQLLREKQYVDDLKQIRSARQKNSFDMPNSLDLSAQSSTFTTKETPQN